MTHGEVIELYKKEREYQKAVFGDYRNNPSLNLGSFLLFLDNYLNKAKKYYTSRWTSDLPPWLNATKESSIQGTAPVDTYEELIKIMALAGAALEAYTSINYELWRSEGIKDKWREKND
jgi:hypothetical protein